MILLILLLAVGCTSTPQQLTPSIFYMRDMRVVANGYQFDGTGVVNKADSYKLEIHAKGKLDLFTLSTCHREIIREQAGDSGWFGNKRKVELVFTPIKGIEDKPACPLLLGGYEKSRGRHSWAWVDFEAPENSLPATVLCDGWKYRSNGVTVCQAREGLIQRIEFAMPTKVYPGSPECALPASPDGRIYEFPIHTAQCLYGFKEVGGSRIHRLTTLGYEDILVRGD